MAFSLAFAYGKSGWKTPESLGESSQGISWMDSKIGGPDASQVQIP